MSAAIVRMRRGANLSSRFLGALGDSIASIADQIQTTASAMGVPPQLALSVAQTESSLNPNAVSPKGAIGLFQLMPATAAQLGVDPTNPTQNIKGGIAYLASLFQQFGDWATALAAYNWGPGNVAKYGAAAAPASTQQYVSSILSSSGPAASASTAVAPLPVASSPAGDVIDVPFTVVSDTATPAASPNLLLLAGLALATYLAADVLRG